MANVLRRCPRCQVEIPSDAEFCPECGAKLIVCASCGTANLGGHKFCKKCGQSLATPPVGQPKFGPPESYTPKHLAEKILTSRSALGGERKHVTVLFADLKGSLELLADRDPEEARKLLDPVLERMMEAVHRYEGTVNQVMGDGIMALFGAPLAHEDHAIRACYAALDMQAAIRRYAEEARRSHGISLQIRVGLNSGEVVVRAIGSDLHMDYTAVGQTTHLAARMEQLATGGRSLLTAGTLRLAEGFIEVKPLGPVPVKGVDTPIEVYDLIGAGPLRSRLRAGAARGLTRFVGREGELDQLRQALGHASGGHGQVAAIVGEPGVGKSRLVWEVTHSHRVHGWLVLDAGSVSYAKATSYLPVVDLLKSYFVIEDGDGPQTVREKLTGKLLTLDRALESSLPALLSLLDVPSDDPEWPRLEPLQRRRRTLDAVKRLLLRESQRQPLLLVFEDLHWIDSETQAVLDGLVESLPAAQLLLLVNYRPEYQHPWGSRTYYTQLRLDPLPPETAEHLLSALLGPDASLDALKRVLITRTEGNPFFLEESVRSLAETGALAGGRGAYRASGPIHATQVPVTVQAVLAARIDRLPFEDKRLLQSASVIGKDVPFVLLHAVGEESEDALRHRLAQLQAAEFIYETSLFPDLEYTFKHALTHEVAYGSVLSDRRRGLHARIVEAIEHLYPDRRAEQIEKLAYHALRGELWDRAVAYSREAGIKAVGRSAYHEAVASFEQALGALAKLSLTQETLEQAVDIRFELRYALWPLGQHRRGLDHMRDAQPLAAQLGDQRRLARLWAQTASAQYLVGDYRGALEAGHRALELAIELDDLRVRVDAGHFLGATYHSLGDFGPSRQFLTANVTALTGEWLRQRFGAFYAVYARTWLTWGLALQGQFEVAVAMAEEAVRFADERYPADVTAASWSVGYARLQRGDVSEAVSVLERCDSVARDASVNVWWGPITGSLGYACVLSGAFERGIRLLEGITEPGATENLPGISEWQAYLADGYLLAGRLGRAVEAAERAVTMARERGERGAEALALRVQANIAGAHDPVGSRAEELYRQGLTLADELGMRPLVAHCHLGLGTLFCRTGDGAKAVEHLATATTMYREMGMGFWLEKAEAALKEPEARAGR